MKEEDEGLILFDFSFSVLQNAAMRVVATSMRRASKGFEATFNYSNIDTSHAYSINSMTCDDYLRPAYKDEPDNCLLSIKYTGWVFVGSDIVFVWSENETNK